MGWINLGDVAPPGFFDGVHDTDPYYVSPEWEQEQELYRTTLIPCTSCSGGRVEVFFGHDPEVEDCPICHGRGYLDANGDPIPEDTN